MEMGLNGQVIKHLSINASVNSGTEQTQWNRANTVEQSKHSGIEQTQWNRVNTDTLFVGSVYEHNH